MTRRKKVQVVSPYRLVFALVCASMVAILLLIYRVVDSNSFRYIFLVWNLILAATSPILAWWLVSRVRRYGWANWKQLVLTAVWIVFLPNSFYVLTDFIHLRANYEASLLYDIVLISMFSIVSMILGFIGVYLVHLELSKRLVARKAWGIIGIILLSSSFAICLGRFTRWNSWDILLKPAGLLFDVSDRLINPTVHAQTYQVTFVFFLLLASVYWVAWEIARLVRAR